MEILNFELGSMGVNSFLIIPENSDAVLIDAPENSYATIKNTLQKRGKKLGALLLTHGPFDHIWDAKKFQNDGVKIYAHPDGSKVIEDAGMQNSILGSNELDAVKIDSKLFAGQILKFGDA